MCFHGLYHEIKAVRYHGKCLEDITDQTIHGSALYHIMTSSNGNIFRVTGHLCGEFTGHRWIPRTKASDVELWWFLWSAPWFSRQSWCWWFETPSRSIWRHCNVTSWNYSDVLRTSCLKLLTDRPMYNCFTLFSLKINSIWSNGRVYIVCSQQKDSHLILRLSSVCHWTEMSF